MSGKLEANDDNKLTSKSGIEKGRPTNISIQKPRKSKKNFKGGVLSEDLKWKIYKSDIEPKLTNKILEDEPNSEMLAAVKHALNEYSISDIGKIIKDTDEEPDDNISNDIITPSHIDASIRERLLNAAENRVKTKQATDKLAGIFKRKQIQNLVKQGFEEEEKKYAGNQLSQYSRNKLLRNYLEKKGGFKGFTKQIEDEEKEKNFLNNPTNTGGIIAHQKELNKALEKRKEVVDNKIKFGNVLNDIKTKEPKLNKLHNSSLNDDITDLMKASLNKSKTASIGTQTSIGSGIRGRPSTAQQLTKLANTYTANPRSINTKPLNTPKRASFQHKHRTLTSPTSSPKL